MSICAQSLRLDREYAHQLPIVLSGMPPVVEKAFLDAFISDFAAA